MRTVEDEMEKVKSRQKCESDTGANGSTSLCVWVGEYWYAISAEVRTRNVGAGKSQR